MYTRTFPSESVVKQIVLGRAGQILYSAHNAVDSHKMVVYNVGEIVSRHTVGFNQNLVLEFAVFYSNISVNHVVIRTVPRNRHILTYNVLISSCQTLGDFFFGQIQTMLIVSARTVNVGQTCQTFFAAKAIVSMSAFHQLFGVKRYSFYARFVYKDRSLRLRRDLRRT